MSLMTYIGSNVELPIMDNENRQDEYIFIGESYSDDECLHNVKTHQFSSSFVYELSYDWWGIELSPLEDINMYEKSVKALHQLCQMMDTYLKEGQYFEFYTCWIGEESEERKSELTLPIRNFYKKDMKILERTLVTFKK